MKLQWRYFTAFIILLAVETCIALFVHDRIIRPYIGDVLVILLLYTLVKSFCGRPLRRLPVYLILFAVLVEILQYFDIVHLLGLENNRLLAVVIGGTFDIRDIGCYLAGCLLLLAWDHRKILFRRHV